MITAKISQHSLIYIDICSNSPVTAEVHEPVATIVAFWDNPKLSLLGTGWDGTDEDIEAFKPSMAEMVPVADAKNWLLLLWLPSGYTCHFLAPRSQGNSRKEAPVILCSWKPTGTPGFWHISHNKSVRSSKPVIEQRQPVHDRGCHQSRRCPYRKWPCPHFRHPFHGQSWFFWGGGLVSIYPHVPFGYLT